MDWRALYPAWKAGKAVHFIDETMQGSEERCMLVEYVTWDSDLAVCMDIHAENWQEAFLQQIGQNETEEKEDDKEMDNDDPPMRITTYREAIRALEDAQQFILSRGHVQWISAYLLTV